MNPWSTNITVSSDDTSDGWDFTLTAEICNQVYRDHFLYTPAERHLRDITATEAIGKAIVKFGNYVLGYELARRKFDEILEASWRD